MKEDIILKSDTRDTKDNSSMIQEMDIMPPENANHVFDHQYDYKSSGHLEYFRQLMIAHGLDPQYSDPSTKQKSNEENYSSSCLHLLMMPSFYSKKMFGTASLAHPAPTNMIRQPRGDIE